MQPQTIMGVSYDDGKGNTEFKEGQHEKKHEKNLHEKKHRDKFPAS